MTHPMTHPMTHKDAIDTMAAERYMLDEMSEQERHQFEEHFFACGECADDMRLGSRIRHDAQALFGQTPKTEAAGQPKVLPFRRPISSIVVPWAAAAVLALALVYQVQQPGIDDQARVFTPVGLRPASRGAVTTVPLPGRNGSVAFALDVNIGAPGQQLTYRLTRDDGTLVSTDTATVPSPGTPLLLVVPGERLGAGGAFVLTLTAVDAGAGPPAEYRFNASAR